MTETVVIEELDEGVGQPHTPLPESNPRVQTQKSHALQEAGKTQEDHPDEDRYCASNEDPKGSSPNVLIGLIREDPPVLTEPTEQEAAIEAALECQITPHGECLESVWTTIALAPNQPIVLPGRSHKFYVFQPAISIEQTEKSNDWTFIYNVAY